VNRLENRLADAFRAAADTITPDSVPGLRERSRRRSWPRLAAPLAAAAAVIVATVIVPVILNANAGRKTTQAPPAPTLWVASQDTVTPVSTATYLAGTPIHTGCTPFEIVVAPAGKTAYVACRTGYQSEIVPINTFTNSAERPIAINADLSFDHLYEGFQDIVITPDGKTAYVLDDAYSNGISIVTPVNLATGRAGKTIDLANVGTIEPATMAMTPDGKTIYVLGEAGTVVAISTATNSIEKTVNVGTVGDPSIAIMPDGKTAYVDGGGSDIVTPINTATNTAGKPIDVGNAQSIVITPDGKTAYVINGYGSDSVTPINTATNEAGKPIPVGQAPEHIAITPNGKTVYVAGQLGNVTQINIATNRVGNPIPVGVGVDDIIMTPTTAYVASFGDDTVTPVTIATNTVQPAISIANAFIAVAITP